MKEVFNIPANERIFVVGDIHGEYDLLMEKMAEVGFDTKSDHMFSVGDLVDRGEDSLKCLGLINEPWFHAVRGNHEEMMINSVIDGDKDMQSCWFMNGGNWYWNLYQDEKAEADLLIKDANNLPYWMEINHKGSKVIVCHADWPSDKYEESPNIHQMIWSRDRIDKLIKFRESKEIKGADLFVFGHTPLKKPLHVDNCMWIDTGAVFGKELTVIEL